MRRLDPGPPPPLFSSAKFLEARDRWMQFHREGGTAKTQRRLDIHELFSPFYEELLGLLRERFEGRCAYTELRLERTTGDPLSWHRPPLDANTGKERNPLHYYGQAFNWENLLLVDPRLQSLKSNTFPVDGALGAAEDTEASDRGLLLDPSVDEPGLFLAFEQDGRVTPRDSAIEEYAARGRATVELLDLNEKSLVESRWRFLDDAVKDYLADAPDLFHERVKRLTLAEQHPGAVMQHMAVLAINGLLGREPTVTDSVGTDESFDLLRLRAREAAVELLARANQKEENPRDVQWLVAKLGADVNGELDSLLAQYPLFLDPRGEGLTATGSIEEVGEVAASFPEEATEIPKIPISGEMRSVRIKNFKSIEEVLVDLSPEISLDSAGDEEHIEGELDQYSRPDEDADRTDNLQRIREALSAGGFDEPLGPNTSRRHTITFLGENGSGKSSLLQAIALVLSGNDGLQSLKLGFGDLIRRAPDGTQAKEAVVELEFSGEVWVRLVIRPEGARFFVKRTTGAYEEAQPDYTTFIRAYGATRLTVRSNHEEDRRHWEERQARQADVANLFDPRCPIADLDGWLLGLPEDDFNVAAATLISIVNSDAAHKQKNAEGKKLLTRSGGQVAMDGVPLYLVSDGYRSVMSMVCDLMAGYGGGVADMTSMTGLVLIDEVGAHLHPRWKMNIVAGLRREFPYLQLVLSTHDPLCLRGLEKGEVTTVTRGPEGHVECQRIRLAPNRLRVDQLLHSEFFGLNSTIDPVMERAYAHYFFLQSLQARTTEQNETMKRLRAALRPANIRADSWLEQTALEIVEEYLAERMRRLTRGDRPESATRQALRRRWEERIGARFKSSSEGAV